MRPRREPAVQGASVPLALRETAEGDQAHERDDEPDPQAPHDHQDNPDDNEDAAETDPARVAARATICCHLTASSTKLNPSWFRASARTDTSIALLRVGGRLEAPSAPELR